MIRLYTPASLTLVPTLLLTIYTSVAFFSESLGWALLCTTTDSYIRDISCSPQTTQSCRGPAVDAQYRRCAIPAPSRLFTTFDWSAPAQGHACVINVCSYFATDRKLQQESQQTMQSKEVTGMVPCPYPIFPPHAHRGTFEYRGPCHCFLELGGQLNDRSDAVWSHLDTGEPGKLLRKRVLGTKNGGYVETRSPVPAPLLRPLGGEEAASTD
jgi:hypothetical protein